MDLTFTHAIASDDPVLAKDLLRQFPSMLNHLNPEDSGSWLHGAAQRGSHRVIPLLVDRGLSLDAMNNRGFTPLVAAIFHGHHDVASLLLDLGANPNVRIFSPSGEGRKKTALHMASAQEDASGIITALVRHGARINDTMDPHRRAALHFAAEVGDCDNLRTLLALGADPFQRSVLFGNLEDNARQLGHQKAADLIRGWIDAQRAEQAITRVDPGSSADLGLRPLFQLR